MTVTLEEAEQIVLDKLPDGSTVEAAIEYQNMYLFLAYWPDPLEGRLDPFFSVNPSNGFFRDFSPSDYDNPLEVIQALDKAAEKRA